MGDDSSSFPDFGDDSNNDFDFGDDSGFDFGNNLALYTQPGESCPADVSDCAYNCCLNGICGSKNDCEALMKAAGLGIAIIVVIVLAGMAICCGIPLMVYFCCIKNREHHY